MNVKLIASIEAYREWKEAEKNARVAQRKFNKLSATVPESLMAELSVEMARVDNGYLRR